MDWEILRDRAAVDACTAPWLTLWQESASRPLALHPHWIRAWLDRFGAASELLVVVCRDAAGHLLGLAPFYLRSPRGGALRVRELACIGDGLIGTSTACLCRDDDELTVIDTIADALTAESGWDLLQLSFVGGDETGALAERLAARGHRVDSVLLQGGLESVLPIAASGHAAGLSAQPERCGRERLAQVLPELVELARAYVPRRCTSEVIDFLELVLPRLIDDDLAALYRVERDGAMVAGALLLRDGARCVELLRGVAAGWDRVGTELVSYAAAQSAAAGARRLDVARELGEHTGLSLRHVRGLRVRVFASTPTGRLHGRYALIERRAEVMAGAVREEVERWRDATQGLVSRTIGRVAHFSRLHLYRGELFVRSPGSAAGVSLRFFSLGDFDALLAPEREVFVRALELEESYCRQKWQRGELAVLAERDGAPIGILWCARDPVLVPELGREVRPRPGECYIQDVFVARAERGHGVAPAMLAYTAEELRRRDAYRAWALIQRPNAASMRAFEKAGYAAVADVLYGRVGSVQQLLVRPPDPEARAFLGLT